MDDLKHELKALYTVYGSHKAVAEALGYTERQYRNLRGKIEKGEQISRRCTQEINLIFSRIRGLL